MRHWIIGPFALLVAACRTLGAPVDANLVVRSDTVVGVVSNTPRSDVLHFTLPISIRNNGATTLSLYAIDIEQLAGRDWRVVWRPIGATSSGYREVKPGETIDIDSDVVAVVRGSGAPIWDSDVIQGTYRIAIGLRPSDSNRRFRAVNSNAFTLISAR